ncbi:hypothetical protein QU481_04545 [Crenobacter sp. SG2303]|uniref:Uncharacterized protein n=1 Tax=Crenobacter oryzisoli TaxID=3056844 RepID=A0ABT7XK43_9NEIS|nr:MULTISPECIES: hypothetical protein [unclassified Crenobacter]MDN0074157.1 hypothetical protein [Crenobacter sp. SG2303]MDN0083428.1 hypothetical protein [Crenobacter sp. SG2305]
MKLPCEHRCLGGVQCFSLHDSTIIDLPMHFAVYLLPQARQRVVPALFYLAPA